MNFCLLLSRTPSRQDVKKAPTDKIKANLSGNTWQKACIRA